MNTQVSLGRLALAFTLLASGAALRAEEKEKAKADVPPSVLQRYDKNKDGSLDEKETAKWEADKAAKREKEAARRAEMLAKYDTNKDGKLSEEEKAAHKIGWQKERTEKDAEKMKEKAAKLKAEKEAAERQAAEKAKAEEMTDTAKPAEGTMMIE